METDDEIATSAIFYAELLATKVVEGVSEFPSVSESERRAMLELVAAKLTEVSKVAEVNHASI